MLPLFGLFNLGPMELILLAGFAGTVVLVGLVVVVLVVVFTRGKRGGPGNE